MLFLFLSLRQMNAIIRVVQRHSLFEESTCQEMYEFAGRGWLSVAVHHSVGVWGPSLLSRLSAAWGSSDTKAHHRPWHYFQSLWEDQETITITLRRVMGYWTLKKSAAIYVGIASEHSWPEGVWRCSHREGPGRRLIGDSDGHLGELHGMRVSVI